MIGEIATLLALGAAHKHVTNKKEAQKREQQRAQQSMYVNQTRSPMVLQKFQCRNCGKMQSVYNVNSLSQSSCPAAGRDSRNMPIQHIWHRIG